MTMHAARQDARPLAEQALQIAHAHLQRAVRSHQQALRLQAAGQDAAARTQSRMTQVLLHNALHHIARQARD